MTERLPFRAAESNAARSVPPAPPSPTAANEASGPSAPLTVSRLASLIGTSLRGAFPGALRVAGEISGLRERTHWFFDLKDAEAAVNCVMFATQARRAGFTPRDGMAVVVTARVDYYARSGRISLVCEKMEPVGAGALDLKLRQLVEELRALGWLDPARKRPLPTFPRRVAVVTSRTGAALQDVLITMKRRCAAVGVLVVDTRVQGDGAAAEVVAAINTVSRLHAALDVDALIVTRGGGSAEDLWAFNERIVAEAIVHCSIPVVAAIGHEVDTTVAELVADERCATPTQAAMRLAPDSDALLRQVGVVARRLGAAAAQIPIARRRHLGQIAAELDGAGRKALHRDAARLAALLPRLERNRPVELHARLRARTNELASALTRALHLRIQPERIDAAARRLERAAATVMRDRAALVEARERQLGAVSPMRVMERGFSVTFRTDGKVVRTVADAPPGEKVETRVVDGAFRSVVQGQRPIAPGSDPAPRPARRRADPDDAPGLFA